VRANPARFEAFASAPLRAWLAVPAHAAEVRAIVAAPAREYRYGAQFRPPGYATVPNGFIRIDPPVEGERQTRHGVVVYDHPLTQEEVTGYELVPYMPLDEVVSRLYDAVSRYGDAYAESIRKGDVALLRSPLGSRFDRLKVYTDVPYEHIVPMVADEILRRHPAPRSGPFQVVVQISKGFRDEMDALESDTYDPRSSSAAHGEFADAVVASRGGVLTLTEGAARYAVSPNGALHNSIDIWTDQEKQARNKANTRARLKGWIAEAKALDATITAALRDHKGA